MTYIGALFQAADAQLAAHKKDHYHDGKGVRNSISSMKTCL